MVDEPRDVVLRVFQYLNDYDLDRYGELFADDVEERHPYVLTGRDAVTAADRRIFALIPDHWRKIERLLVDGDTAALWLRFGGTYATTGERFEIEICGLVGIRDGKIVTWNFYSDRAPLPQELGDG